MAVASLAFRARRPPRLRAGLSSGAGSARAPLLGGGSVSFSKRSRQSRRSCSPLDPSGLAMHPVDPGSEDQLRRNDTHGLALKLVRDGTDNGGVIEEALLLHTNIGGKNLFVSVFSNPGEAGCMQVS